MTAGWTVLAAGIMLAQDVSSAGPADSLFAEDSVLEVTIEAPLSTLMDERPDEVYLEGSFSYLEKDGTRTELSLKLRTRGNYRRDKKHCDFAPIRLNFRQGEVQGTVFAGQDKLKLVTHCRSRNSSFEQVVAREYLAYHLLREVTPVSYGVRMFRITYVDTESESEITRLGFVIEDDEAVARRNGLEVVKTRRILPEELDRNRQSLIHVFEYMIGNTEYSFINPEPDKDCCHNVDVLAESGTAPYLPLPFDYDFAGMVNAPYAEPNPRYPIDEVRTRFYKGICDDNDVLPHTLDRFIERRDALQQVVDSADFLSRGSRRTLQQYLDAFFRIISDPKAVHKRLVEACAESENSYS